MVWDKCWGKLFAMMLCSGGLTKPERGHKRTRSLTSPTFDYKSRYFELRVMS